MVDNKSEITKNEDFFDKQVEDTIETANKLTPSMRTLKFSTELASSMTEDKLNELYRQMDNDAIISAALDLFADNVAQENPKTGHVVSVVSKDKSFEAEVNDFLHNVVNMDTESWNIVRTLAQYGKVVLDTRASNRGADWAFIEVDRPEDVLPLTYGQDNIKYFAVKNQDEDNDFKTLGKFYGTAGSSNMAQTYEIEQRDRYIVGFNGRKHIGKMTVETQSALINGEKDTYSEELYIRAGKSLLEGAIEAWQTLSTLEDSLFINRLLKSTTFNVVSIDVSDTNNKQAQQMIDEVKATLRASETIDAKANRYSSRQNPIPVNDFIYVPVKGEKGAIRIEQVGGEVGDIDLSDIDYYRNKLFAALGVLKAYLGFEETTPGGLGDTTLTMLDERFARKVKRLRTTLGLIVRQMVEYYWLYSRAQSSLDTIPEFSIELGKISTNEEAANRQAFLDGINTAENFLSVANAFPDHIDEDKLFTYVFSELIGIDISKIDNKPMVKDIGVSLKQLKEVKLPEFDSTKPATVVERTKPKYRSKKVRGNKVINFMESDYKTLTNSKEFKEIQDTHEFFIRFKDGRVVSIENLLKLPKTKQLLGEKTYKDLKQQTKNTDPERIKKSKKITGTYIGYDPVEDVIIFEMTAEDPTKNRKEGKPTSYEVQIRLNDLLDYIKERKTGQTDLSIVRAAMQGDIKVGCECPASKYWGQQYNGTKQDYSIVHNDIEPTRNKQYQTLCKHVVSALTLLPFWTNTIVKDLRQSQTFVRLSKQDQEVLSHDEELETLDQIVDIETGGKGVETNKDIEDTKDTTDSTHKAKPQKVVDKDEDKDKDLKQRVADEAPKTKSKKNTKTKDIDTEVK